MQCPVTQNIRDNLFSDLRRIDNYDCFRKKLHDIYLQLMGENPSNLPIAELTGLRGIFSNYIWDVYSFSIKILQRVADY